MRGFLLGVAVVAAAGASSGARAAELLFTLTGGDVVAFELPSQPQVTSSTSFSIDVGPTAGILDGAPIIFSDVTFGDFIYAPALFLETNHSYYGPQLFSGPPTAPVFSPGTFSLNGGSGPETLVISVIAPVPEPGSWALCIVGFALVGAALRRRWVNVSYT